MPSFLRKPCILFNWQIKHEFLFHSVISDPEPIDLLRLKNPFAKLSRHDQRNYRIELEATY